DVTVIQLVQTRGQPVLLAVAEHELQQFCQVMQVLAGVIEVDDRSGLGYLQLPADRPLRPAAVHEPLASA
ncbi:MAG TPA: hypothetical protein VF940_25240, partial [Streptosporangiaceae bacterium]